MDNQSVLGGSEVGYVEVLELIWDCSIVPLMNLGVLDVGMDSWERCLSSFGVGLFENSSAGWQSNPRQTPVLPSLVAS